MNGTDAKYIKMTQTPIPRLVITLGIPTTISMLITNIYNMADSYFVSKIDVSAGGATSVVFGIKDTDLNDETKDNIRKNIKYACNQHI